VKRRIDHELDENRPIHEIKASGNTRDEDETIRETKTTADMRNKV